MSAFSESFELVPYIVKVQPVAPDPVPGLLWLDTASSSVGGVRIIKRVTANYTVLATDDVILVDASGGSVTITMEPITIDGKQHEIKSVVSTANLVTVDGNGTETIDDALTADISYPANITIVAELSTTSWKII